MPKIRITPTLVEIAYKSLVAPLGCAVAAIVAFSVAVFVAEGFINTTFAVFAGAVCALLAAVFFEQSSLCVDVEAGRLSYTWRGFRPTMVSLEMPLNDVRGVLTQYNRAGPRRQSTYRTCLVTTSQTIPLTRVFSSTAQNEGAEIHRGLTALGLTLTYGEEAFDFHSAD